MDIAEVKALLRIRGDDEDDYMESVLPLVLDGVRTYTGRTFLDEQTGEDAFPGLVKMAIAKWVQAYTNPAGVTSQGMSSLSQSFTNEGIPAEVKELLDRYTGSVKSDFTFIPMPQRRPVIGVPDWRR